MWIGIYEDAWKYLQIFCNIDISSLFIFGLDPSELEPFNLDFKVELPSVEEWLQGIKLKFSKVDVSEVWQKMYEEYLKKIIPKLLDFDKFIEYNIEDEFQEDMKKRKESPGLIHG